jgi:ribosomal protein S18 acetylase RimI-like enzyme
VTKIEIRPYRDADFDAVTCVRLRSWKSNGVQTPIIETAVTYSRRKLGAELAGGVTYVATIRFRIVGFIVFHGNEVGELFVAPTFQRQGIGKQLLDFAKQKKPDGLWLTTLAQNTGARRFYEREGLSLTKTAVGRRPGSHCLVRVVVGFVLTFTHAERIVAQTTRAIASIKVH